MGGCWRAASRTSTARAPTPTRDDGSAAVWERIRRYLADDLGVEAPITHRWVGTVGYSEDGLPVVGERDGVYVAGGYSGHGNVLGYLAGQQLADLIAG